MHLQMKSMPMATGPLAADSSVASLPGLPLISNIREAGSFADDFLKRLEFDALLGT